MGDVARDGYALKTVVTSTGGMLIGLLRPVVMSWITVLPRMARPVAWPRRCRGRGRRRRCCPRSPRCASTLPGSPPRRRQLPMKMLWAGVRAGCGSTRKGGRPPPPGHGSHAVQTAMQRAARNCREASRARKRACTFRPASQRRPEADPARRAPTPARCTLQWSSRPTCVLTKRSVDLFATGRGSTRLRPPDRG